MRKNNCPILVKEFNVFEEIILSMTIRRVVYDRFVKHLKENKIDENNDVFQIFRDGYVVAQISDCRKFFDKDSRVYSFFCVVCHSNLKKDYNTSFRQWESAKFKELANQHLFHKNKKSKNFSIQIGDLNNFIAELKNLFEKIFDNLLKEGFSVSLSADLMTGGSRVFLKERENEVDVFFTKISEKKA